LKKLFTLLTAILISTCLFAQAPQKMSYQAVIHNSSNNLITNQTIGMRISILQGSVTGTPVYVETQTPTSNNNGLVSLEIGGGSIVTGSFVDINWASGPYFVKIETDPTGGSNYSITGTSQFLSVPYALYAEKTGNSFSGDYKDLTNKPIGNKKGEMLIWTGSDWARLPVGANGMTLTMFNGLPTWTGTYNNTEIVTDIDGNMYHTVKIGSQVWMVENLKTTKYSNGESLPNCSDNNEWSTLNTGAYCEYNNDQNNGRIFGKLYNWYVVNDVRKVAPIGWHIPSMQDFYILRDYLYAHGFNDGIHESGDVFTLAKSLAATTEWFTFGDKFPFYYKPYLKPNVPGYDLTKNNSTGFTALPGSLRNSNGQFGDELGIGGCGEWWLSEKPDINYNNNTLCLWMGFFDSRLSPMYNKPNEGLSIRCIKD